MKQWFPLTDYDFYAYITAGMLLIAAADYTFGGAVLVQRTEWTVVQLVFWGAVAYLAGQLAAGPSSSVLEHLVARRLMHPPVAVCPGLAERRRRERWAAALFAGREYSPLPAQERKRIIDGAAAALGVPPADVVDPEAVFGIAFRSARAVPDAAARMDQFRNLYGMSRNVAFVSFVGAVLLLARLCLTPSSRTAWLLAGSLALGIGMFGRFLKFYAAFSREVLGTYASKISIDAASAQGTAAKP